MEQIKPVLDSSLGSDIQELLDSGSWLTEHEKTKELERTICSLLNVTYCSMVSNGTMALILSLKALNIGKGDKVGVPALTMVATAEAVRFVGAEPVFFDVNDDLCLETQDYRGLDAVIFVSLNGRGNGIVRARQMCDSYGIPMIEDACQSFMSSYGKAKLGTIGELGCFSLSPHKIITSGQGGFVVTDSKSMYESIERLKDFGRIWAGSQRHDYHGINSKFTDLQSVVALNQLKDIHARMYQKRVIWDMYHDELSGAVDFLPKPDVPWMMDIYSDKRDELYKLLEEQGIKTRKMYGVVPHEVAFMMGGRYPIAEKASQRGLFLPSSVDLTRGDVVNISETILGVLCKLA